MHSKIIAVDFDGTLCTDAYPNIGDPMENVIEYVKSEKSKGAKLILWTNRSGKFLEDAVAWCKLQGIDFDAVNDNIPEVNEEWGENTRKVFANEYIDDRFIPFPVSESGIYGWAKREVDIVKRANHEEGSEYLHMCLDAALEAYATLIRQGHSGNSIVFTASILNRLISGKPLTGVEDDPDEWNLITEKYGVNQYQSRRMSSLFKYEDTVSGEVWFKDVNRFVCVDRDNPTVTYHSSLVDKLMHSLMPISMPYCPGKSISVYCTDFQYKDNDKSDFDTVGVHYAVLEDGSKLEVNRFFKETDNNFAEICQEEYLDRLEAVANKTGGSANEGS